jgi:NADH-quinone oxidoreductase subunit I
MTRHAAIRLIEPNCTSCMVCARECPTWCIAIDSHTAVTAGPTPGSRPRTTHVLDRFAIDWSLCMYCGICIEECPFDALEWADTAVPAGPELLQELASPSGRPTR